MPRKGASLIFEQVMLFMVGIIIFMLCFSIFRTYEFYYAETIKNDQLSEVNEYLVSQILSLPMDESVESNLRVTVPEDVGGESYTIKLDQDGLNTTTMDTGISFFSPLSSINQSFSLSGGFSTVHGTEFLIYKRGNQIIIG